jgi:16S rRNA (uracil1498-N3)-methyltransferase
MTPRLYVAEHLQKSARFQADERAAHYLVNVLRRGSGDPVLLFNGATASIAVVFAEAQKRRLVLEALERTREQEAEPDLWLCFAPLKKDAVGFPGREGTELGVARFQPVLTQHTGQQPDQPEPAQRGRDRGRRAIRAADRARKSWSRSAWKPCAPAGRRTGQSADLRRGRRGDADRPGVNRLTSDVRLPHKYASPDRSLREDFQDDELDRLKKLPFVTPVGLGASHFARRDGCFGGVVGVSGDPRRRRETAA